MRCCIYKERAIVEERVKLAMGGDKNKPERHRSASTSPATSARSSGYVVTEACRGCLAHRCEDVCRRGAITFDDQQKAHIDKSKCVELRPVRKGLSRTAPSINHKRPCENACKIKAITMKRESTAAQIDNDKCISCGACVYQCPFGAIVDKSFILDAIDLLQAQPRESETTRSTPSLPRRSPASSAMQSSDR